MWGVDGTSLSVRFGLGMGLLEAPRRPWVGDGRSSSVRFRLGMEFLEDPRRLWVGDGAEVGAGNGLKLGWGLGRGLRVETYF